MGTLWGVSHKSETSLFVKSFAFLLFASHGWARAYQESVLSLLFVFHQSRLFLENRPLRMCELRSCLGGISPDQGGSQIEWCLISGQESGPSWQCQGGPTLGLWRARHGWREARTAVGSSQSDKMTAQAHENLSAPQEAVQSIAKAHQRLSGLVLRRRSKRAESLIAPNRQATASMSSLVMEERYQSFSRKSNSWVLANRALCSKSHAALM